MKTRNCAHKCGDADRSPAAEKTPQSGDWSRVVPDMTGPGSDYADLRRVGSFKLSHEMLRHGCKPIWSALMSRIIILRAESIIADDSIHYVALCDDFAPVDLGGPIPEYTCIIARRFETVMEVPTYTTRFVPVNADTPTAPDYWRW